MLAAAQASGDVIVVPPGDGDANAAYDRATARIVAEARALAEQQSAELVALAVWDRQSRGSGDATLDFVARWQAMNVEVVTVDTLSFAKASARTPS